jgi:hypothetical protein
MIGAQRLRDHNRLLVNLLLHEVAVVALFDQRAGYARGVISALDRIVVAVEDLRAFRAE